MIYQVNSSKVLRLRHPLCWNRKGKEKEEGIIEMFNFTGHISGDRGDTPGMEWKHGVGLYRIIQAEAESQKTKGERTHKKDNEEAGVVPFWGWSYLPSLFTAKFTRGIWCNLQDKTTWHLIFGNREMGPECSKNLHLTRCSTLPGNMDSINSLTPTTTTRNSTCFLMSLHVDNI